MIITEFINIRISGQGKYYKSLGYSVKQGDIINIPLKYLPMGSHDKIKCQCDECPVTFERDYRQIINKSIHRCYDCNRKNIYLTRDMTNTINALKTKTGKDHHRWKDTTPEFKKYSNKVHRLTREIYKKYKNEINPDNLPRKLCGIPNGYQLDHKISIKYGFDNNIKEEFIAHKENLQMLSWEDNRKKW